MALINKWDETHNQLELAGKFDTYTTPIKQENVLKVDKNFVYKPQNLGFKIFKFTLNSLIFVLEPCFNRLCFGLKIKGRKNLKGLKGVGAITVSNHTHYLDNLWLRQATVLNKEMYYIVAPHNCKQGFVGAVLKAGGVIPLPVSFGAAKHFNGYLHELIQNNKFVHFYPEQALWWRYEKPRPFKEGAFRYAVTENSPVVPCLVCYRAPKGLRKLLNLNKGVTVNILEPIYPDVNLPKLERIADLSDKAYLAMVAKYREFYGVTDDNIYTTPDEVLAAYDRK